ncbi:hypothetical protein GE21DRAFT_1306875 [Neurospora crassa]|nr:hypothetical protein GE21DRAFT_1306875 [Neurospora crassa]
MTTLTEFHLFRYFPAEIRFIIWTLALRPLDRPGVHIFDVVETTTQLDRENHHHLPRLIGPGYSDLWGLFVPPSLLPQPTWTPPLNYSCSWVSSLSTYVVPGNVNLRAMTPHSYAFASPLSSRKKPDVCSTYLLDGGLWTASKESRRVIQQAFGSRKLNKPFTTALYRGNDSRRRHAFTVFQGRDLFIYRPIHKDRQGFLAPGWEPAIIFKPVSRWGRVLCGEPNRLRGHYQPNYRQLDKLGQYQDHMAIEWDSSWVFDDAAFEELTKGLISTSLQRGRIWFVDYGLRPISENFALSNLDVAWKKKKGGTSEVFEDAQGGRYVEVYFSKIRLDLHTGERISSEIFDGTGFFVSPDGSLKMLEPLLRRDLPELLAERLRLSGEGIGGEKNWAQWGILAYLPPGFEEGKQRPNASPRTGRQETVKERMERLGPRFWLLG